MNKQRKMRLLAIAGLLAAAAADWHDAVQLTAFRGVKLRRDAVTTKGQPQLTCTGALCDVEAFEQLTCTFGNARAVVDARGARTYSDLQCEGDGVPLDLRLFNLDILCDSYVKAGAVWVHVGSCAALYSMARRNRASADAAAASALDVSSSDESSAIGVTTVLVLLALTLCYLSDCCGSAHGRAAARLDPPVFGRAQTPPRYNERP